MSDNTNSAVAASFARVNPKTKTANPNRTPEQAFAEHNAEVQKQNTPSSNNPQSGTMYTGPIGPQEKPQETQQTAQQSNIQKIQQQSLQPKVANQQQINQSYLYFNTPEEKVALTRYNISQNEDVLLPIAQRNIQEYRTKTSPTSGTKLVGTELQSNYDVAVQKEIQFFNQRADESVQTVAFSVGAGYGLGALGSAAPIIGKGLAIAAIPVTAKRAYDIFEMSKESPNAARYQTSKFAVELGGMAFGGYLGSKDIAALKEPTFEVTRATEPTIIRIGREQYLVTKQYKEFTEFSPKVDQRIGIEYMQLSEKTIGSPETILAQIRTSQTGKGFVDFQTKEFNPGYSPKLQKELFNVGEFARSPEKYVISAKEQVIETKITPDLSLIEKYNAVKVSKSEDVVMKLNNLPEDNIMSLTKGKFFKQSKALALYEEKSPGQNIPIPKIKIPQSRAIAEYKEISVPQFEIPNIERGFNPGSSGLGTETINRNVAAKETSFEPIVSVKEIPAEVSPTFTVAPESVSVKNIKFNVNSDFGFASDTKKSSRTRRELKQESVLESPKVSEIPNIIKISNISERSRAVSELSMQTPKVEQIEMQIPRNVEKVREPNKSSAVPISSFKLKPFGKMTPEFSKDLRSKEKKSKTTFQAFDVEIKRGGKFKTFFRGLTKSEALGKGSRLAENTLARTFRIRPSGRTSVKRKSSAFKSFKFYGKKGKPGTFIQRAKFSLGTFGEKGEIKRSKYFKASKF